MIVIITYQGVFVLAEEGLSHTCEDTLGCLLGEAHLLRTFVLFHEYVQHHYLSVLRKKHSCVQSHVFSYRNISHFVVFTPS